MAYLQSHLNHDDTSSDRGPESKLTISDNATRDMWYDTYKEQFPISGTMYRGENFSTRMYKMTNKDICDIVSKQCCLRINSVSLENYSLKSKQSIQGKIELKLPSGKKEHWKLKSRKETPIEWVNKKYGHLLYFDLDTKNDTILKVTISSDRNPLVTKKVVTAVFHPSDDVDNIELGVDTPTLRLSHITPEGAVLILSAELIDLERKDEVFRLDSGSFETVRIPDSDDSFWGTIPIPHLPNGLQNMYCRMATHK